MINAIGSAKGYAKVDTSVRRQSVSLCLWTLLFVRSLLFSFVQFYIEFAALIFPILGLMGDVVRPLHAFLIVFPCFSLFFVQAVLQLSPETAADRLLNMTQRRWRSALCLEEA